MATNQYYSSDSHIIEPVDLWEKRIDRKFIDRAPHLVREGDLDQWYCDGMAFGSMGVNQQAGVRFEEPEKLTIEGSMDTVRPGGLDPHAHIEDMDADGIAGGVLYPSQMVTLWMLPASDMLSAAFRAYNDYVAEFCEPFPNRLKGIAALNVDDVEDGVEELERAAKMGMAGGMISARPMLRYDHPAYDRLWATAQDLDMPLSLHTGTHRWRPGIDVVGPQASKGPVEFGNRDAPPRECIGAMIYSGVFERYPKLRVGAVEYEVSWAIYFIQAIDQFYTQRAMGMRGMRFKDGMLPSDFFRRNVFISFQDDDLGIQHRDYIGLDNLMWGSDYPHAESTFPRSREVVDRTFQGVPEDEKAKMVRDNTARLYHFDS